MLKTKIYEATKENIAIAASDISNGKLVVFPTETVYGIGANALDEIACTRIFEAKNRPVDNPLIVHISDKKMLNQITSDITEVEQKLIDLFFPGPFTLILKKSNNISKVVTGNLNTVAVRMPKNDIARELIELSGVPIAAPSANLSGKPSGTDIGAIEQDLSGRVDTILKSTSSDIGLESTVAMVQNDHSVTILRPGFITKEDIEKHGFTCQYDEHIYHEVKQDEVILSPGMKHRHYSPATKTILLKVEPDTLKEAIEQIKKTFHLSNVALVTFEEHLKYFNTNRLALGITNGDVKILSLGRKKDVKEISHNLFYTLRKIDKMDVELCVMEWVGTNGLELSVSNRMLRACSNQLYEYIDGELRKGEFI